MKVQNQCTIITRCLYGCMALCLFWFVVAVILGNFDKALAAGLFGSLLCGTIVAIQVKK